MKFKNFLLGIQVLKYVLDNPRCTVPEIKNSFGVNRSNPPRQEEKNLYKVISYLQNSGYINKIEISSILPGGARFYIKTTQKGSNMVFNIGKLLGDIRLDFTKLKSNISEREEIRTTDLTDEFSSLAFKVIKGVLEELLSELPLDARRFLLSKRAKLNALIRNSHKKLQDKVSNIIESLI